MKERNEKRRGGKERGEENEEGTERKGGEGPLKFHQYDAPV